MSRGDVNVFMFFVDAACLATAPASDDVILMCEAAKVSGTVTSHASGLLSTTGSKWLHLGVYHHVCWFLVCKNLCPFDCPPDDVIEYGMTLMSGGTFPAREAVKSSDVNQFATYTGVR